MNVFRLCKAEYADDLSGKGAEQSGGRWNSRGVAMLYTSATRALCIVELAVHIHLRQIPDNYVMLTIELPKTPLEQISAHDLSEDWNAMPHTDVTQTLGDSFITRAEYLLMKAPSAVVPGAYNYLINPDHEDFNEVSVKNTEPFQFDDRLFK